MASRGQVILKFHRRRVIRKTERAWEQATRTVAKEIAAAIKQSVGTPYPPASAPGTPPHKRTGQFQTGVRVEGGKALTVRSVALYGGYLEHGTSTMDFRPWAVVQFIGSKGKKWARRLRQEMRRRMR